MAVPTAGAPRPDMAPTVAVSGATAMVGRPTKSRYLGRSPEEWGQALDDSSLDVVRQACHALTVMRGEGRPYLWKGLTSAVPETRRMCLEALSVADLRTFGHEGRATLVRLAGDRADLRIRERATRYLKEWNKTSPAP
jgi:hypothetical protein